MTGSVSKGENNHSQSLQMTERPLMSADELKSMKKGSFIVMKTGAHPFISKLKLFTKWGIAFDQGSYSVPDKAARPVFYAGKERILGMINKAFPLKAPVPSKQRGMPPVTTVTFSEYEEHINAQTDSTG